MFKINNINMTSYILVNTIKYMKSNLQTNYQFIPVLQKFRYFFAQHFQQKAHKQDITTINPKSTIYHIINWLSYFSPFICLVVYIQGASQHGLIVILYPFQMVLSTKIRSILFVIIFCSELYLSKRLKYQTLKSFII